MNVGASVENFDQFPSIRSQIRELKAVLQIGRELAIEGGGNGAMAVTADDKFLIPMGLDPKFMRVISAMKILRHVDRAAEHMYAEKFFSASNTLPDKQDYLKHDLLYFIAATDSNEDTLGHSQFVAAYSLMLAKAVGIESPRRLWDLERGALLHDIGKIAIPDSILKKPGPLTALEKEIVKEHPLIGYEIIREFDFLKNAAQVVRHHHERFDGKGYPHGLAGENILLEARVFSIADTIDAITSDRPYREGRSFKEAFQEIEKCAWSHFDPVLIDVMHSIPKERWLQAKLVALSRLTPPTFH